MNALQKSIILFDLKNTFLLRWLAWACLFFFLFSCRDEHEQMPVARVFDNYLYRENILAVIPPDAAPKDSEQLAQAFINNWIRQNLIVKKAELNLPEEMKNVQKQLDDYRTSLIIYAYEKELVRQKLDTIVPETEIENYYKKNKNEFELKDYIVKVLYVKLEKNSPDLKKVSKWYKSKEKEDLKKLEEYCRKFAVNFFVDTEVWLFFDDLLKEIPIESFNKEEFLKSNIPIEFQDESYLYFVNILEYRLKDDISPLSLVREKIVNILLNKRKIALIENMRKDIFEDALEKNNFEIYE